MKNSNTRIANNIGNIVFNIYNAFGKIYPDKGWGARKLLVYETKIIWKCLLLVEDDYESVVSSRLELTRCYFNLLKLKEAFDDGILLESQLQYELTEPAVSLREIKNSIEKFFKQTGGSDEKEKLALYNILCCLSTIDIINKAIAEALKIDLKEEYLAAAV